MSNKEQVLARLSEFLDEFKEYDGSWKYQVTPYEVNELHAIFRDIVEAKYERDFDGDLPIKVLKPVDLCRRRVPFVQEYPTGDSYDELFERLITKANNAESVARELDEMKWLARKLKEASSMIGELAESG